MKIADYKLGSLATNCYVLEKDGRCLVIDPAAEADFLIAQIQKKHLEPIALLATHGHFDHVMATGEIQASYFVPLIISENDRFLVDRTVDTARHFLGYDPVILPVKNTVDTGDAETILKKFSLTKMATPGHTPGSFCYYLKEEGIVFSGDTLFQDGFGSYDHRYSDLNDLKTSLKKLSSLPPTTKVYPGHGEPTTIGSELDAISRFAFK